MSSAERRCCCCPMYFTQLPSSLSSSSWLRENNALALKHVSMKAVVRGLRLTAAKGLWFVVGAACAVSSIAPCLLA
jgi:hypothetical protein